ncbi:MAG: M48 family metalloprotease [Candidatus Aminicenantales bacterium]
MRGPTLGRIAGFSVLIFLAAFLAGCAAVEQQIGTLTGGKVSARDVRAVAKTTKALRNSFADITEEEEYYIGRAVAAMILSRYPALKNEALTRYVNEVGAAVVAYSDRPETFAGYHFLVLDTQEVNAMAAPGGFIFVTRGLLRLCKDEEMLGSILAHEVGHVAAKHGLQSIKKSRLIDAFRIIGEEAAQRYAPERLAQLTDIFERVLGDIAEKLIERGYDRKYEYEADRLSVRFAARTGYNPQGLLDFLKTLGAQEPAGEKTGWFRTHPSAAERLSRAEEEVKGLSAIPPSVSARTQRFQMAMRGLR